VDDDRAVKLEIAVERLRNRVERLTLLMAVLSTLILGDGALRLIGV
jgi:hypothetical protein